MEWGSEGKSASLLGTWQNLTSVAFASLFVYQQTVALTQTGYLESRNPSSSGRTFSHDLQPPLPASSSQPLSCYLVWFLPPGQAPPGRGEARYHCLSAFREGDISTVPSCPWGWLSTQFPPPWALRTSGGADGKDEKLTPSAGNHCLTDSRTEKNKCNVGERRATCHSRPLLQPPLCVSGNKEALCV